MELKERFEEASEKLPIQTCLDGRLEILYHGFKFVKEKNGGYDILDLTKGEHQLSVYDNDKLLRLFENKPFMYVCDLHLLLSSSKKLLDIELNSSGSENYDVQSKIRTTRLRIKRCVRSL